MHVLQCPYSRHQASLSALLKLVKHQHWTIILGYAAFVETNRSNLFWFQCNQLLATSFETLSQAGLLINHISWRHHLPPRWKQKFGLVLRSFNANWLHFVFSKAPKRVSVRNKGIRQQTARVTVQMSSNNGTWQFSKAAHKYCPLSEEISKWYIYIVSSSSMPCQGLKSKKPSQRNENTHTNKWKYPHRQMKIPTNKSCPLFCTDMVYFPPQVVQYC